MLGSAGPVGDVNVLLVDYLACPRCGPAFGLVLLAREVRERRVRTGVLGCANCRDEFPVEDGFADLRLPPRGPPPEAARPPGRPPTGAASGPPDAPLRIAAALGVARGAGVIVLSEGHADATEALSRAAPEVEAVVLGWAARGLAGASPMAVDAALPFRTGVARGVALAATDPTPSPTEAARVLAPGARVVVTGADPDARAVWEKAGLRPLVDEAGTLVLLRR